MLVKRDREHYKIFEGAFDNRTMKFLTSLSNKRYFKTLDFPISTGKEADVFRATTKRGFIAIKIYRIETSNFVKSMNDYIFGDPRFEDYRKSKRGIIQIWCQKEFRNLEDAKKAGLSVPRTITFEENILLMQFLGKKGKPYSTLDKSMKFDAKKYVKFAQKFIIDLYNKARLVHADFSEFNTVVASPSKFVVIDMGQAVHVEHPKAQEFLRRDIYNLARFAKKYGIKVDEKKIYESCRRSKNSKG